ncbi:MAG: aminotransferase class I/II-fold pyridoxal phosphate-dependent enzyme [Cyclobacteriaceae bacterium]|nr:aminotransferase class I/II-fold pyridoxal phosphate-dependent enzyme [Cyclobacteriaceae bacterium]
MTHFETKAIRIQSERTLEREHSVPVYLTSSFVFDDSEQARAMFAEEIEGNVYSRFSNPNTSELESKISALEETESAFATASGMAAVFASIAPFVKSGDHIVSSRSVFGNTHKIMTEQLPQWNISCTYADIRDKSSWEQAIQKNTVLLFVETPSNPTLDVIDLQWLSGLAKSHGLLLVVDNCFATPYLQQPVKFGADLIVHSGTKYIDGQGRVLGGVVAGPRDKIKAVKNFVKRTGASLSPFNAWVLSKSLETLAVRMDRHCDNAEALAKYFQTHPEVINVTYPFLDTYAEKDLAKKQMKRGGGLVCFEIKGGVERGKKFIDSLKMISLTANLGDTRSIITHPASTTHSKLTKEERKLVYVSDGLVRISAGLEHIEDIMKDLDQAFTKSKQA